MTIDVERRAGIGRSIRVLLVDDHEMARRGLQAMLSTAEWIEVIGEAAACDEALRAVESLRPDLVLLDIRMPGADGLACLERLKRLDHPVAVVMVTLYDDPRYVLEAIRRGAAGYILKDASTEDVIATLVQVADGQLAVEPGLLRDALVLPEGTGAETRAQESVQTYSITPRELDVLRLVADGMTNKEIGGRLGITEDTVKKHVQNLIWKLRAADRTQAAIVAYRAGLLGG